ncbi:MAG: DUF1934 domain-containing protein [Hungatella sp.]|jgi:uncharacterized beta-barrel protein YwiB (DUF1934 family)|nr:DUF1934 domain-containing protein [Hungatella sp.]
MTKEVLINIGGARSMGGEEEDIEMIVKGDYYKKNGKHYILYDELLEGGGGVIRNTIRIVPDCMDIMKKGSINTHMIFEKNKKSLSSYVTPMGELMVEIRTNQIQFREEENLLVIAVEYSLDINYQHVWDCSIKVSVRPLGTGNIKLE